MFQTLFDMLFDLNLISFKSVSFICYSVLNIIRLILIANLILALIISLILIPRF